VTCRLSSIVGLARGDLNAREREAIEIHLQSCQRCRRRYALELELSRLLQRLDDAAEAVAPVPNRALVHAFHRRVEGPRLARRARLVLVCCLAASVVAIAVARRGGFNRMSPDVTPDVAHPPRAEPFVSVVGTDRMTGEELFVLRVIVPRGALSLLGAAAQIDPPLEPVDARVVVGGDGMTRGVVPPVVELQEMPNHAR